VGLFPKNLQVPFLKNLELQRAAVDGSVLALGIFSRGQLKDDSTGSLRKLMSLRSKDLPIRQSWWSSLRVFKWWSSLWWGPGGKKSSTAVFAIEGLVDGPDLPERSARVLLSRIEKYALEEQRIVVVSKRAWISSDGTDLTEYYVRLGFEKLEMEDGLQELVYTKRWSLKKGAKAGTISGLNKDGSIMKKGAKAGSISGGSKDGESTVDQVDNQQIMTGIDIKNQQNTTDRKLWALQAGTQGTRIFSKM